MAERRPGARTPRYLRPRRKPQLVTPAHAVTRACSRCSASIPNDVDSWLCDPCRAALTSEETDR